VVLPAALFLLTCGSTFFVGAANFQPELYLEGRLPLASLISENWLQGLQYMGALLAILLTHEMGHFIAAVMYHIPGSLPYFIPLPVTAIGTLGAVIGLDGLQADRKQTFDMGLAGPLAGLVVAIPVLWIGIMRLEINGEPFGLTFQNPLIIQWMIGWLRPELGDVGFVGTNQLNPFFMAGWVGIFITGLNMLPVSQLDGGHTIYALFRKRAHLIARAFIVSAIAFIIIREVYVWVVMLVLIILLGADHPRTANDNVKLGPGRWVIGLASLSIPFLCFPPLGIELRLP